MGYLGKADHTPAACTHPQPAHTIACHLTLSTWRLRSIWDSWVIEDGRYTGMSFTDGTPCSDDLDRSTVVLLLVWCVVGLPMLT